MLIGISGKARSGKDLLYSIASKEGFIKLSFAALLKKKVRDDFGLTYEHTDGTLKDQACDTLGGETPRKLMIELGNLYRSFDSNYWVNAVMQYVHQNPDTNFMITDVRYVNEVEAIRNNGGITVRLERHSSRDGLVSKEAQESASETALDNYTKWDFQLPAELNETESQLASFWNVVSAVLQIKI